MLELLEDLLEWSAIRQRYDWNTKEIQAANHFIQVVLVRMCADGVKAPGQRYRYSNAVSGLVRIGREEGIGAFTKGLGPNIVRSILMSESIRVIETALLTV